MTLAEMLISILLLLLVTASIGGAMPSIVAVYTKAMDAGNAEMLTSTAINKLRDELDLCRAVKSFTGAEEQKEKTLLAYTDKNGYECSIVLTGLEDGFGDLVRRCGGVDTSLIAQRKDGRELKVSIESITLSGTEPDTLELKDFRVKGAYLKPVTTLDKFSIKCYNLH